MRIGLIAYGTRGDVQPILALALGLRAAGHAVRVITSANFGEWVVAHGLDYAQIGVDIQAIMQSEGGVAWVEARNTREEMARMRQLFSAVGLQSARDALAGAAGLDLLIAGLTSDPFGRSIAEKLGQRYCVALLQPMTPTRSGAATLRPASAGRESIANLWAGRIAQRVLFGVFGAVLAAFRSELGLQPLTPSRYYAELRHVLTLNGYSPQVVPRPADWPPSQHITGYWFLEEEGWSPPPNLLAFLEAGPPPIYVGFGSATASNAQRVTAMIIAALAQSGQRGVISQGWAGLHAEDVPESVFLLQSAPHSWLFPRMAGVVHHGGAGTTAAGLRAGVPSFLIPHFADQPYWGRRVHELGVGPQPVDKAKLTLDALVAGIRQLVSDAAMRQRAARLGEAIRAEDGVASAVRAIEGLQG